MLKHKRFTAFLMSLLICAATAAYPASTSFADNEDTAVSEDASADDNAASDEDSQEEASDETIVSGDFTYSITSDNTACIENCSSTELNLVIPDTIDGIAVTELGPTAFGEAPPVCPYETISLPASINYISSDNPFSTCEMLKEIKVDSANKDYCVKDNILYSKDMTAVVCYPQRRAGTSFTLPDSVKKLGFAAIYNTSLTELKLNSALEEINPFSLAYNNKLESIDFSNTALTEIAGYSVSGCKNLSDVKLGNKIIAIRGAAFYNCNSIADITLPEKLEVVEQYAFMDTALEKILIPSSVAEIGYCAFGYYTTKTGVEAAVKDFLVVGAYGSAAHIYATDSDDEYEYSNDFAFTTFEEYGIIEEMVSLETIVDGQYEYAIVDDKAVILSCSSTDSTITVPSQLGGKTVTAIYPFAFQNSAAQEIIIPDTVTTVREMAFCQALMLKNIVLPQSVTEIGDYAFDSCASLESIDAGGAVMIGESAFTGCKALKTLTISGNCEGIYGSSPFTTCTSLESITVTEGDGNYSSEDGILYNKDKSLLITYPTAKAGEKFKAPESVTEISPYAFYCAKNLVEADISSVEIINPSAFRNCEKLEKVKLSKDLTIIDDYAFHNCNSLTSLRFYDKLETVGDYAFGLTSETDQSAATLVKDFKIYAESDSLAYQFAKAKNIQIVSGTIYIFGMNIDKKLVMISGGALAAALIALITLITRKSLKKKKERKKDAEAKENAAKKRSSKSEAESSEEEIASEILGTDEEPDSPESDENREDKNDEE
ncbi:MAG: leucine-rich repeat protein [Ruminococcus sp.]|nr:leucine-rich repeat protein [Ruminococcus sp.]